MSMLRIRYETHRTRENCKISMNSYASTINGAKYKVIIDEELMVYMLRNERSKECIYTSKTYTNMNALKKAARSRLEVFGVPIGRESRKRSFGLCPKGFNQEQQEDKDN